MVGIEAGNRDRRRVTRQQLADDRFRDQVARGLNDNFDAALMAVFFMELFEGRIEHLLPDSLEQHLSAGEDNATATFGEIRLSEVPIHHSRRQIRDDGRDGPPQTPDDPFPLLSVVGMKAIFVAVRACAVAQPANDEIDRLHVLSS